MRRLTSFLCRARPTATGARFACALIAVSLGLLAQYLVLPGPHMAPFVYLGVLVAAWFGGRFPGLFSAAVATGLAEYVFFPHDLLFFPHANFFAPSWFALRVTLIFFTVTAVMAVLCATLGEAMTTAQRAACLLDLCDDAIFVWSPQGGVEYWNEGARELYGWTVDEARGRAPAELFETLAAVPWNAIDEQLRKTGRWDGEIVHRTKDGKTHVVWAKLVSTPGRNGTRSILELNRDITATKEGQRALASSEARFRTLAEAMPQLVWERSAAGRFEFANRNLVEFTGLSFSEVQDLGLCSMIHPDDLEAVQGAWKRSVETREPYAVEYRLRRAADGVYVWFLSRAVPLLDDQGAVVRWLGTCTGIQEQKEVEARLREANERLADVDRRKDQFLGMLSHELRNPLAAIRGALFVVDRAEPGSPQMKRGQAVIGRQVDHLTKLVDDLLDVTRVVRGKIVLQCERVDLVALARRTADDLQPLFLRQGVALENALPPHPVFVSADPTRLVQVVGNLLENAVKFTPRGGNAKLSIDDSTNETVVLRVSDSGVGLAAELIPHLFVPFMQADTTLDRTKGGLGLGLALVKGILELHGGQVRAESAGVGTGATFSVTLPALRRDDDETRETTGTTAARPRAGRRVLLIEDNLDAAETLKEALELENHVVEVAHTGEEGLDMAHTFHPDVVLCDIGLPGHDGYWVARSLRADPSLRAVTLVALSGYASSEDVARGRLAGFDKHLAKPADIASLDRALTEEPERRAASA